MPEGSATRVKWNPRKSLREELLSGRGRRKLSSYHCAAKVMVSGGVGLVLESGFEQSYTVTVLQACSKNDGFWWSGTCFGIGF